jgi:voltage-gated potassium channel
MTEQEKLDLRISDFPQWRKNLHRVIFGYDTFAGKLFDILLLVTILFSILAVMMESVPSIRDAHGELLHTIEWSFTVLFTLEYVARLITHPSPKKYIFSTMGIIDLVSIIPTYLSLFSIGSRSLSVIRSIRFIRVFRILKLTHFVGGAQVISQALYASRHKIVVFLGSVICIVVIVGTLLYVVEGAENGFTSIPRSIYWAIVTLTTVGYGDIAPQTVLGQTLASVVMIMGYAILAVPTGIVTGEMINNKGQKQNGITCSRCQSKITVTPANYCNTCGEKLA